ncbi:MAG: hypothetical protein FWE46_03250 [Coriobacteriia bacterium]|nr:hypothetical protein [Coriobacteriia bacterium]MCL2537679.1 hypothetical protein [Coriobacteriia bacterium]
MHLRWRAGPVSGALRPKVKAVSQHGHWGAASPCVFLSVSEGPKCWGHQDVKVRSTGSVLDAVTLGSFDYAQDDGGITLKMTEVLLRYRAGPVSRVMRAF